jgi:hypothetical protein
LEANVYLGVLVTLDQVVRLQSHAHDKGAVFWHVDVEQQPEATVADEEATKPGSNSSGALILLLCKVDQVVGLEVWSIGVKMKQRVFVLRRWRRTDYHRQGHRRRRR